MLVVAETIPPTSDVVPLIAKFYMAGMCEMAIGLIWTCYILKYYHSDVIEMPPWVRKYVLGYLGHFFGINMDNLTRVNEHSNMRKHLGGAAKMFHTLVSRKNSKVSVGKSHVQQSHPVNGHHIPHSPGHGVHNNNPYDSHLRTEESLFVSPPLDGSIESMIQQNYHRDQMYQLGERILEKVETLVENSVVDDRINNHKEEWRIAAMVMDKVSLWVFSITVCTTIVGCFLQAPGYVE